MLLCFQNGGNQAPARSNQKASSVLGVIMGLPYKAVLFLKARHYHMRRDKENCFVSFLETI